MEYERDYQTSYFHKAARKKTTKAFKKAFRMKKAPEIEYYGINVTANINELKMSMEGKTKPEVHQIKEQIKYTEWRAAFGTLISIKLDPPVNQLICQSDLKPVGEIEGMVHQLLAILDLQIPKAVIYGRAAKQVRTGGGKKGFTPYPHKINGLEEFESSDINLLQQALTQKGSLFNIFEAVREGQPALDAIQALYPALEAKQPTGDSFIDTLNGDKYLMKYFHKVAHYGEASASIMRGTTTLTHYGKSATDVSTVCAPLEGKTVVSIFNYKGEDRVSSAFAFKMLLDSFKGILGI